MAIKLTDEQRALVEDNANLIYGYCAKHHLDVDEYFGVLSESLCTAVRHHDPSKKQTIYLCVSMF